RCFMGLFKQLAAPKGGPTFSLYRLRLRRRSDTFGPNGVNVATTVVLNGPSLVLPNTRGNRNGSVIAAVRHVCIESTRERGVFVGAVVIDGVDLLGGRNRPGAGLGGRVERAATGGEQVRDEHRGEDADDR